MGGVVSMVATAAACVALSLLFLVWAVSVQPDGNRRRAVTNLSRDHASSSGQGTEADASRRGVRVLARALTPAPWVALLDRALARAGRPSSWPLERVLVVKLLLAAITGGLSFLALARSDQGMQVVLLSLPIAMVGWFLPDVLIYNYAMKRSTLIRRGLPDVLDQLTIAVEAGLGFDAALAHVGRHSKGPLGDELIRTLQDIQVGAPRREAYRALAERSGVDDLRRFARAIVQAEQYGVSVASVLLAQANEMRVKRRQRAEESALKIPVKVIFPLVVFILPTLFIVVLGPVALNIFETFRNVSIR